MAASRCVMKQIVALLYTSLHTTDLLLQHLYLCLQTLHCSVCCCQAFLSNHQLWLCPLIPCLHGHDHASAQIVIDELLQHFGLAKVVNMFTNEFR